MDKPFTTLRQRYDITAMMKYTAAVALACVVLLAGCSSSDDKPEKPAPTKTVEKDVPRPTTEEIAGVILSYFATGNTAPANLDTLCAGDLFFNSELSDESLAKMVDIAGDGVVTDEAKSKLAVEDREALASLIEDVNEICVR